MGEGEAPGRERQGGGQAQGGRKLGMGKTRRQRGYGAWWGRPAAAVGATRPLDATRVGQRRLVALEMTGGRRSAPPWPRPWGRPQPSQRRRAVGGIKNPVRGAPALSGGWAMGGGRGARALRTATAVEGGGSPRRGANTAGLATGAAVQRCQSQRGVHPCPPRPRAPLPFCHTPPTPVTPEAAQLAPPIIAHSLTLREGGSRRRYSPPPSLRCRWSLGGQSRSGAT